MNTGFVLLFLLSCLVGGGAGVRAPRRDAAGLTGVILILCSAGLAGAVIAAAETGSATARYLGLLATLFASAILIGAVIAVRRNGKAGRH